jgi:CrcB protein
MLIVVIGVGGAIGAVARYLLGGAVQRLTPGFFPYGTVVVNVVGCLVFGLIIGLAESRFTLGPTGRAFVLIGVLGGFTTFSSFTYESFELLRDGQVLQAAANVAGQVVVGFLALWAGFIAARVV